jgi:hypothetical protein
MTLRELKHRAQEKHGHYNVYSCRIQGYENDPFGELSRQELRRNFRSRIGISTSKGGRWRKMK